MVVLGWIGCIAALALFACLVISFVVSWKLTHNNVRRPIDDSPAAYGLEFESVAFPSRDGTQLKGWFIASPQPSRMTIIFSHGYRGNRLEKKLPALKLAKDLTNHGFHVLMFDFRSCGESDGTVASIGLYEQEDLLGAIDWVKANHPSSIGLVGFSMGASTALLAASRSPDVAGVVADSPFAHLPAYLAEKFYIWTKLPSMPFTPLTLAFIRLHVGNPHKVHPKQALQARGSRPVLLIHGDRDQSIPYANSVQLHEAGKDAGTRLWIVPGADHVQSYKLYSEEYTLRVVRFLDEAMRHRGER